MIADSERARIPLGQVFMFVGVWGCVVGVFGVVDFNFLSRINLFTFG